MSVATARKRIKKPDPVKVRKANGVPAPIVKMIDPKSIRGATVNWSIYHPPAKDRPSDQWMEKDIMENGVRDPLHVSKDGVVISGNRRQHFAVKVGRPLIPVIVHDDVIFDQMSEAEQIAILVNYNLGIRVKSDAEQYMEASAAVDPEAAVRAAKARKAKHFAMMKGSGVELVESRGKSRRTNPSNARSELLNAVVDILKELREKDHLPTSSRHIHYKLLARKVRTSTYKTGYIYGTRKQSSGLLSKLLTDARSEGLIDPDDINDETRPTQRMEHDGSVANYVTGKLDGLFSNYFSNVHADQPHHIEILMEKNTLYPLIFKHVAQHFRTPICSMRGYGSFPVSRDIASRFKKSGKKSLVIIYVSDLDPAGADMPAAVKKYLLEDFGVSATVVRAAVTLDQVHKFNLPADMDVKEDDDSRAKGFIAKYGRKCWELDSMPAEILIDEVTKSVSAFLDIDALNKAFAVEREADIDLARMGAAVNAFVKDRFREKIQGADIASDVDPDADPF